MSAQNPYGFECDYFAPWRLSENNFKSIEEEMFITPVCLDSKIKLAIYAAMTSFLFLVGLAGIVVTIMTYKDDGGWNFPRFIKIFASLGPVYRGCCFLTVLLNNRSALRYFLYALPITTLMLSCSLVVMQWFLIVSKLNIFVSNLSLAKNIIRRLLIALIIFNLSFCIGEYGFWLAASAWRNQGGDYSTHNILIAAGFGWQALCTIIFTLIILWVGSRFSNILASNTVENPQVQTIAFKVKIFTRLVAFAAINVAGGSLVAVIWMATTIHSERGMAGFFYFLMFVFVLTEAIIPVFFFWLLLKGPAFGLSLSSEKEMTSAKNTSSNNHKKDNMGTVNSTHSIVAQYADSKANLAENA